MAEARAHHSSRYWLLKTLCLNNLYGVDLMAEAAEIAKLRLFLKLAAQLDDPARMEPLPDLDFNIKSGNLLVGIADATDIERRFSDRGVLPFGLDLAMDAAESVAAAYDDFVAAQAAETGTEGEQHAKGLLQAKIKAISGQVDAALYEMRNESQDFEEWRKSHQPFHWFAEFPAVWRKGGFDAIIGNPPYIGLKGKKRNQFGYKWVGYETENCPDLYAVCTERASTLLNKQGRFAMIVMHSLCFHNAFEPNRKFLENEFVSLWISSYSRAADCLFSGSAKVRNSIIISSKQFQAGLFTTRCHRWLTLSRLELFQLLEYGQPSKILMNCGNLPRWPFADNRKVADAFTYLVRRCTPLEKSLGASSDIKLGFKTTAATQTLSIYTSEPPTIDPETKLPASTVSNRSGWLSFEDARCLHLALLCLAGRWGYLWWLMFGDEFDVTRGVLVALPCDIERLATAKELSPAPCDMELVSLVARLFELSTQLQEGMTDHVEYNLRGSGDRRVLVGRYMMWKLRHITDEADWLLAQAWGLTWEQYEAAGNLRDRMTFGNRE